jgi:hypothetical protein
MSPEVRIVPPRSTLVLSSPVSELSQEFELESLIRDEVDSVMVFKVRLVACWCLEENHEGRVGRVQKTTVAHIWCPESVALTLFAFAFA